MVKIAFKFIGKEAMINWVYVIRQIMQDLKIDSVEGLMFNATFSKLREPKTFSQLAYLHSKGLMGRITQGYRDNGEDVPLNKKMAEIWTKNQIKTHPDVMFLEEVPNVMTGKTVLIPRSFSGASKEELSSIIDWCVKTYQEYFKIELETVKQYKIRKGYKI